MATREVDTITRARDRFRAGEWAAAEQLCQQRLRDRPGDSDALHLLGRVALALGRHKIAAVLLGKAAADRPGDAKYQRRLGEALRAVGRPQDALPCYRRALEIDPADARTHVGIAVCLIDTGDAQAALASVRRAVVLDPQDASSHRTLGVALLSVGQPTRAAASFRRALALDPDFVDAHGGLLFSSHYTGGDRAAALAEARRWGERHAAPLGATVQPHANTPDGGRRLRIGYVSGDLHNHPVGYFLEGVLRAHDRQEVEVYCYANAQRVDATTYRLRGYADHWRIIWGMSDAVVADVIRRDGIDLLVDLSGHTAGNRLQVFARKPAPVQVTWLGYFATTGVEAIDYLIADGHVCPEGDEQYYVERVVRLPGPYLCFTPPQEEVAVVPPPSLRAPGGAVTFGCFNNVAKVTPAVAAVWSQLLNALPEARLLLKSAPLALPAVRRRYTALFRRYGVPAARVTLEGHSSRADYLAAYGRVDVALDPFPYNGGTTTAEALWMGVPVVSLRGDRFVSRMGQTHLSAVGLEALVADAPGDYVQTAVKLARSPRRLTRLRAALRRRVERSPLCDAFSFTGTLETAYRAMWQEWCASDGQRSTGAPSQMGPPAPLGERTVPRP